MAQPKPDYTALALEVLDLSKSHASSQGGLATKSPLVQKAEQLIRATQTPLDHAMSNMIAMTEASALRVLLEWKVFDLLPRHDDEDNKGTTAADLEAQTGVQAALLERFLRVLAGADIVRYDAATKGYANTALAAGYKSDAMAGSLYPTIFDEIAVLARLPTYFQQREAREPEGEKATTHNPRTWNAGQEGKTIFEILEQDPAKLKGFMRLMGASETVRPWVVEAYRWAELASEKEEERPILVDIGGGDGTFIAKLLEAHPEIKASRCVVQDRGKTIASARKNASLPGGVQLQPHDFFTPQPIKGARAYHLRAITHDWSDTSVVKLLKQIVPAMAADSKVLIADNVLPDEAVEGFAGSMDLMMLCIGGKERTRTGFEQVVGEAGLRVEGVWRPAEAEGASGFAVVECGLR